MSATVRTAPKHGERACYLRGCRLSACCDANYRYMSRYRLDRERGQKRRIDSSPAANHVDTLLAAGWNKRQIAEAARCAAHVVTDLAVRRHAFILPRISASVLAIAPYPVPPAAQYVDATGTTRRIRALIAIGYPISHIAEALGIWSASTARIARGELAQVTVPTAKATVALYSELRWRPGPSQDARNRALRDGWYGPLAWDDIDDIAAEPDIEGAGYQAPDPRRNPQRSEEIRHLASFGYSADSIAKQVGLSVKDVKTRLGKIRAEKAKAAAAEKTEVAA
jgi:hypothetical protein